MSQGNSYTAAQLNLTNVFQDAASATVVTQTPVGLVVVLFQCYVALHSISNAIEVKLVRGSTDVATRTLSNVAEIHIPVFFIDSGATASTSTVYKVQARNQAGAGGNITEREIIAIELAL